MTSLHLIRSLGVWLLATLFLGAGALYCTHAGAAAVPALLPQFDAAQLLGWQLRDLLAPLAAALGLIACVWLWILISWTVLDVLTALWRSGAAPQPQAHDSWVRRLTLIACGMAVSVAGVMPAHAGSASLDGLPFPERPTTAASTAGASTTESAPPSTPVGVPTSTEVAVTPAPTPAPAPTAAPTQTPAAEVPTTEAPATHALAPETPAMREPTANVSPADPVGQTAEPEPVVPVGAPGAQTPRTESSASTGRLVLAQETLWSIASEQLTDDATSAQIAAATAALHAANKALLGENPDLIIPGQRLAVPESISTPHAEEATR